MAKDRKYEAQMERSARDIDADTTFDNQAERTLARTLAIIDREARQSGQTPYVPAPVPQPVKDPIAEANAVMAQRYNEARANLYG